MLAGDWPAPRDLPARSRHGLAWLRHAVAFAAVGLGGLAVNVLLLWLLADPSRLHLNYLLAAALATQGSTAWNFAWIDRVVFRRARKGSVRRRFLGFAALNNGVLLLRIPFLALLVDGAGVDYRVANVVTLALTFLTRLLVSDRVIFRPELEVSGPISAQDALPPAEGVDGAQDGPRPAVDVVLNLHGGAAPTGAATRPGTGYLAHRYDVGGVVTVGSQVPMPELEYFRAPWLGRNLDIEVRVGAVGSGRLRKRATMHRWAGPASVRFEEHMGRLGANFQVDMGMNIEVTIAPLLARSPHVVYTNVLEALLRFVMVQEGRMLLHSACVELDGRGLMLSARTDTGKTGTILRLLREQQARFLSDDMTMLQPDGTAFCFPKPLTISHHTLRAVDPGDLSAREWRKLRLRSRLHSKEGRQWGLALSEVNVPLMTLNALTQYVVPPPKYVVDRLVPADVIRSVSVDNLFILERGAAALSDVEPDMALRDLIENTDDAYGFPPFRYFAPAIVLGGLGYEELRDKERDILAEALRGIRVRRMASPSFSWAEDIPRLLRSESLLLPLPVPNQRGERPVVTSAVTRRREPEAM